MKKQLALFSMLLALVLLAPSAFAQDTTTAPAATTPDTTAPVPVTPPAKKSKASGVKKTSGRADTEMADLTTELNLTDDQQAKIKPIVADELAKIHSAKKATTGSTDDEKANSKKIRTDANAQIRALLTPDQQKTFDASAKKSKKSKDAAPAATPAPTT